MCFNLFLIIKVIQYVTINILTANTLCFKNQLYFFVINLNYCKLYKNNLKKFAYGSHPNSAVMFNEIVSYEHLGRSVPQKKC